jgi:hypothetical protein
VLFVLWQSVYSILKMPGIVFLLYACFFSGMQCAMPIDNKMMAEAGRNM